MKTLWHDIRTWLGGHKWSEASAPFALLGIDGLIFARVCSCGFKDSNGHFVPSRKWMSEKIDEYLGESNNDARISAQVCGALIHVGFEGATTCANHKPCPLHNEDGSWKRLDSIQAPQIKN